MLFSGRVGVCLSVISHTPQVEYAVQLQPEIVVLAEDNLTPIQGPDNYQETATWVPTPSRSLSSTEGQMRDFGPTVEDAGTLNLLEVLLSLFLIHSSFIDFLLQPRVKSEAENLGRGTTHSVAPKLTDRTVEKVTNTAEYGGANGLLPGTRWSWDIRNNGIKHDGTEPVKTEQLKGVMRCFGSIGNVLDSARFLFVAETNEDHEAFIHHLVSQPNGEFVAIRQKSNLVDPDAQVKQCIFNLLFKPTNADGTDMTFRDMLGHQEFERVAKQCMQRNSIKPAIYDKCVEIFKHDNIITASIQMVVECQLYISRFFAIRALVHTYYRFTRADTFMSLTMDCANYAIKESTMSCCEQDKQDRLLLSIHGCTYHPVATDEPELSINRKGVSSGNPSRWHFSKHFLTAAQCCRIAHLWQFSNVFEVVLDHNDVKDEGAEAIAQALSDNTTIIVLTMVQIGLTAAGAALLAESIKTNKRLDALLLSCNNIGDEGARHMAELLTINTTLSTLDLSNTNLTDDGVRHVAEALKLNRSARHRCVQSCKPAPNCLLMY